MEFVIAAVLMSALMWGLVPRRALSLAKVHSRVAESARRNRREVA
ncbi:hypothetical protein PTW32_10445 [Dechloromonas agitata]|nr:hypothetical protein [Dechloromonas agitata]MDE1545840.1 hypothetical protein [Dechloromonas agitata]